METPSEHQVAQQDWSHELLKAIGERVCQQRTVAKISMKTLSERTAEIGFPIARNTIWKIEGGAKASLSVTELLVIAHALQCSPAEIVLGFDDANPVELLPNVNVNRIEARGWFGGSPTSRVGPVWAPGIPNSHKFSFSTSSGIDYAIREFARSWVHALIALTEIIDTFESAGAALQSYVFNLGDHKYADEYYARNFEGLAFGFISHLEILCATLSQLTDLGHRIPMPLGFNDLMNFGLKLLETSKVENSNLRFSKRTSGFLAEFVAVKDA